MQHSAVNTAVQRAMAALQAGDFATARDASAPVRALPAGALLHALGTAGAGDVTGGAAALHAIARANPDARPPVLDLVDILHRTGRAADAIPHLRAALSLSPTHAVLAGHLGALLAEYGPAADAVTAFEAAARAAPSTAAWSNLGKALAAMGRFTEAEAAFARMTAPTPQLRLNHGIARLKSGDWPGAWPLFRARHALPGRAPPPPGPELLSLDAVAGRHILLLHDEGFGDTMQFIRYAPLLTARGAHVTVHVPPPLRRLLSRLPGITLTGDTPPRYECWARIPDLPAIFGTTPDTIPAPLPPWTADPAWTAAALPEGRRIGLVWAGAARAHDPAAASTDRIRSIPPARLVPLLHLPGITWISLQHGAKPPPGVFDAMPAVRDFADTAAIIARLDAVVSVDTAVAHLAASMGKNVLLLDRFDHCWRWLPGREDSPWYPTMRIARQRSPGDWEDVMQRAAEMLT